MLSKVLSHRNVENVQVFIFPTLNAVESSRDRTVVPEAARSPGNAEMVALREKIHQLEAQAASDRRQAFEEGREQGEQQARVELQPVLERLNASLSEITAMRPDLRHRAERDVVQLALLIARRVLHRQLSVDEEALTAIARVAFERLTRSESYRVTVNPQFAAAVTSALPGNHASRVQIEPDANCAPGTLIIHSSEGVIDASVDAQLEEISRGLADRLVNA
jgi:flagellar assembly protein FliH